MIWLLTWLVNHTDWLRFRIDGVEYRVTNGRGGPLVSADVPLRSWNYDERGVEIEPVPVPCHKCGQINNWQTGEYPCEACGLPLLWDEPTNSESSERSRSEFGWKE